MIILGVDPGSRLTGYGVIQVPEGARQVDVTSKVLAQGTLRLANTGGRAVIPLERRLLSIHQGLSQVVREFRPDVMVIEKVFFAKNPLSALKLGQARGAAIVSAAIHGLQVVEYSPSEVKLSIVGHGHADKGQVAQMLRRRLGDAELEFATEDASDGLALAVCHAERLLRAPGLASRSLEIRRETRRTRGLAESLGLHEGQISERRLSARDLRSKKS